METATVPKKSAKVEVKSSTIFGFIKPEGVDNLKEIFEYFKKDNFSIIYNKKVQLRKEQAQKYFARDIYWKMRIGAYALYSDDPKHKHSKEDCLRQGDLILKQLIRNVSEYKVILFILNLPLEYGNAIERASALIGHTDPVKALPGTIRHDIILTNEVLRTHVNGDGFLYNIIDLCKKPDYILEAITNLVPDKDLKKYNFLSHIQI